MIDLSLLREYKEKTIALLKKKDPLYDTQFLFDLDKDVREIRTKIEELRQKKNELAQRGKSGVTDELREASIALGKELKVKEIELTALEEQYKNHYLHCPNIPMEEVPAGNVENNKILRVKGEKRSFNWESKNHLELGSNLGWFDFEIGAKIAKSNFALYKSDAVRLLYSLSMLFLKNNIKHGFEPVLPPYLVNEKSLIVSGNFPKFKDQVYHMPEDDLYLTPTAEVDLANIYRNEILSLDELPIRLTALTSCFRREAGNYGAHERGMIRMHQFEKAELFTICVQEKSEEEFERMLACAEDLLKQLGLHYRVSLLAGQDTSFQSAKTYDIEVWLPGQKEFREVSSCSICTDFQARRGLIRYKESQDAKAKLVHTLNGSSLALPRVMVALMETYQQEDGSIILPDVLKSVI